MLSSIGTTTVPRNGAQLAALEKQLAQYEKELRSDQSRGGGANSTNAQVVATQISLLETEIAELSNTSTATTASLGSALGNNVNVTA